MKVWKMNLYKLTHKKSFVAAVLYIFFFIFVSASSYSSTINSGDLDGWDILRNFDLGKYVKIASTDILYQGTTLFSLMIFGILLLNLYLEDFNTGTYKYIIISGISKKSYYAQQLLFMVFIVLSFIVLSYCAVLGIGCCFWGTTGFSGKDFTETLYLYLVAAVPICTYLIWIFNIAMLVRNKWVSNFIAVLLPLLLGIVDSLTRTKLYSPFGLLCIFNQESPVDKIPHLAPYIIPELIWLFIGAVINFGVHKKYQN